MFVSLGDLLDRGPQSIECLKFIESLDKTRKILIRGNHEDLLERCLKRKQFKQYDYGNGTVSTVMDLSEIYFRESHDLSKIFDYAASNKLYKNYMSSLQDYAEIGNNIFVHGWIPCNVDDPNMYHSRNLHYEFDENWREGNWIRARWFNGMDAWNNGIKVENKIIYCGHWHTSWGHHFLHNDGAEWENPRSTNPEHRIAKFDPFIDKGIVALDACTARSRKVNCFVLEI